MTMEDLRPQVEGRPIAALASRLVPDYPAHIHAGVFGFNREVS